MCITRMVSFLILGLGAVLSGYLGKLAVLFMMILDHLYRRLPNHQQGLLERMPQIRVW